jgi:transposase
MITIGVDAHKSMNAAFAVDDAGREAGQWEGPNTEAGWHSLAQWAAGLGEGRQWGIEGAWGYGRGLAQHLVGAGETVYEINARWTALRRRSAHKPGKTDQLDAQAIALFVRQEGAGLPRVLVEDETTILELLTAQREGAQAEANRLRNQIHALLLQLDPEYKHHLPPVNSKAGLAALQTYSARSDGPLQLQRARVIRRLAERLALALAHEEELAEEIRDLAEATFTPLTKLCGVNLLTAGKLAAILGPGNRFSSDAQLASYAGVAPLEASSAGKVRHRLNRGGNRRLNHVLYFIVLTQARHHPEAQNYLARRIAEGKSRREAHRALKRFVIRAIWRLWQECVENRQAANCRAAA